jgi:hypothetical protein
MCIYIFRARAHTHTQTHPRTIHRLVSVMQYRCTRIFHELWIEYLCTRTLFYPTSDIAIHPEPFAWRQTAQLPLPFSTLSPVESIRFISLHYSIKLHSIHLNKLLKIYSIYSQTTLKLWLVKAADSDYRQLPKRIISLYNVDQPHHRKVRDLMLWATVFMLVSSWRLR